MKATQQQRLTLALQAAANIVPVQFQLQCRYFSPAVRSWRIMASAAVFFIVLAIACLLLNIYIAAPMALLVAYLFFSSVMSVWLWPKALLQRELLQRHHRQPQPLEGAATVLIIASQYPCDLRIYTSKDLAAITGFAEISATNCALISSENLLEAMVSSLEACVLAVLPVAASLAPQTTDSSLRVLR